jgi:hypothetical protein
LASSLVIRQESNVDDLISIGGSGGFSPTLGAPVLAAQQQGVSPLIKFAILSGSVLLLGIIVIGAVIILRGQDGKDTQQEKLDQLVAQLEALRNAKNPQNNAEIQKLEKKIENEQAVAAKTGEPLPSRPVLKPKETGSERRSSSGSSSSSSSSRKKERKSDSTSEKSNSSDIFKTTGEPKDTTKPSKSSGSSELDDLLGNPSVAPRKKPENDRPSQSTGSPGGESDSSLPETLNRNQVQDGMNGVAPEVKRCGQGQGGTITMSITIGKTGRIISANATGAHAGTPVGLCAARAVRRATFPKFGGSNLNVKYPFKL